MLRRILIMIVFGVINTSGLYQYPKKHHYDLDHEGEANYAFNYGVRDHHTGDIKNHWETRKGDKVKGEYSLVEPDGTIRTVKYTADKHSGFNAVVLKQGKAIHPTTFKQNQDYASILKQIERQRPSPRKKHHNVKPVYPDYEPDFYPPRTPNNIYEVAGSSRQFSVVPPDVPPNHKPVYTGINEQADLLALYNDARDHFDHPNAHQKFDYGINEYVSRRNRYKNLIGTVYEGPTTDHSVGRKKSRKRNHKNRRSNRNEYRSNIYADY